MRLLSTIIWSKKHLRLLFWGRFLFFRGHKYRKYGNHIIYIVFTYLTNPFQAIDLVSRKSEDERLIFTVRLYDADGSGKIDINEMAGVIETLDGLGKETF